ncbi:MAG TPA: hypothetical protein VKG45_15895 [Actinomycetes bacterium]|nr:hypothetical protein [Actinomycetes bacterium]
MRGDRPPAGRWAARRVHAGVAGLAAVVRLLTTLMLLGTVLLIVALVGQGVAGAREVAPPPAGPPAALTPVEILSARLELERTDAAGPDADPDVTGAQATVSPATAAGARAGAGGSPAVPDRHGSGGPDRGALIVPRLGEAWKRTLVADTEEPGAVLRDGADTPLGNAGQAGAVVAQTTEPTITPQRARQIVTFNALLVSREAASLGALTEQVAGDRYHYRNGAVFLDSKRYVENRLGPALQSGCPGGWCDLNKWVTALTENAKAHADAAKAGDNVALDEARKQANEAASDLGALSYLAGRIASDTGRVAEIARARVEQAGRDIAYAREAGSGGRSPGGQKTQAGPTWDPDHIARIVTEQAQTLEDFMKDYAASRIDDKFRGLVTSARQQAQDATSSGLLGGRPSPADARAKLTGAVDALDRLADVVGTLGQSLGKQGTQLSQAADQARQTADRAQSNLAAVPRQSGKGSWLEEDPPDDQATRHAGGEPELTAPTAVTGTTGTDGPPGADGIRGADGTAAAAPVVLDAGSQQPPATLAPQTLDASAGAGLGDPFANQPWDDLGVEVASVDSGDAVSAGSPSITG